MDDQQAMVVAAVKKFGQIDVAFANVGRGQAAHMAAKLNPPVWRLRS